MAQAAHASRKCLALQHRRTICMIARERRRDSGCRSVQHPASADHSQEHNHDGDHQQYMDEATHRGGGHQPQQPQDEQNYGKGI